MSSNPDYAELLRSGAVSIRPADGSDLAAVLELLRECDLPAADLALQFGERYVVAHAPQGSLIAVAGIEEYGRCGLLRSVAVAPPWRGQGLGERLARERLDWARRRGLEEVFLLTTCAAAYWPRFGFQEVSRDLVPAKLHESAEWNGACPSSATVMRLPLRQAGDGH
jgi:amino-acid N-acetyltransferase